ncbi:MAG: glyoxylate/hydroxypyruvate reductase A [Casimicrobiaceae bacterium]
MSTMPEDAEPSIRVAVVVEPQDSPRVLSLFAAALPEARIVDARTDGAVADYVVAGFRDDTLFERQRAMKAVFAFGAGVNGVLALPGLPASVPVIRLEDAGMAAQMVRYVLATVLRVAGGFDVYAAQQRDGVWRQHAVRPSSSIHVGVLGIGVIGGAIARSLAAQGFRVRGHARSRRTLDGVDCRAGDAGLDAFLDGLDILVAVLPLTPATRGLLCRRTLGKLAVGAHLINIGRGALVNDTDLIGLLDEGKLRGATLDVFDPEPLPHGHPFWSRSDVTVTPHVSGTTLPDEAVTQIAAKIRRLERGGPVTGVVDRTRGY